jgi:hypothetical protein
MIGGSHKAELLKSSMVRFNTRKHTNESILYTVDSITFTFGADIFFNKTVIRKNVFYARRLRRVFLSQSVEK